MEQIFLIEAFVTKILLKIEPPVKDEYELRMEEEERRREAEALAALEASKKGKKGKGAKGAKGKKKGKKGKEPPPPSEEEVKFLQSCTMQMSCLPLFDFYIAHDNFISPPPPEPPGKKGKKKPKPKKGKKGKVVPQKIILPSEPLPNPPYFGVGNAIMFLSRPTDLVETLKKTPIYITVWDRKQEMNCIGCIVVEWDKTFFDCLQKAITLNPLDMDKGQYRSTKRSEIVTNTIKMTRRMQCEEDLRASGEIEFYIKLSCLGNNIVSYFVSLPELGLIRGRKYILDDLKLKDMEVVRHWEGTLIDDILPVAYIFGAPEVTKNAIVPVEKFVKYEKFVPLYTASELAIVSMGYPQSPCKGLICMHKRGDKRSQSKESISAKHNDNVSCSCGKLTCPHPQKELQFICHEGMTKTCHKPCLTQYNTIEGS